MKRYTILFSILSLAVILHMSCTSPFMGSKPELALNISSRALEAPDGWEILSYPEVNTVRIWNVTGSGRPQYGAHSDYAVGSESTLIYIGDIPAGSNYKAHIAIGYKSAENAPLHTYYYGESLENYDIVEGETTVLNITVSPVPDYRVIDIAGDLAINGIRTPEFADSASRNMAMASSADSIYRLDFNGQNDISVQQIDGLPEGSVINSLSDGMIGSYPAVVVNTDNYSYPYVTDGSGSLSISNDFASAPAGAASDIDDSLIVYSSASDENIYYYRSSARAGRTSFTSAGGIVESILENSFETPILNDNRGSILPPNNGMVAVLTANSTYLPTGIYVSHQSGIQHFDYAFSSNQAGQLYNSIGLTVQGLAYLEKRTTEESLLIATTNGLYVGRHNGSTFQFYRAYDVSTSTDTNQRNLKQVRVLETPNANNVMTTYIAAVRTWGIILFSYPTGTLSSRLDSSTWRANLSIEQSVEFHQGLSQSVNQVEWIMINGAPYLLIAGQEGLRMVSLNDLLSYDIQE